MALLTLDSVTRSVRLSETETLTILDGVDFAVDRGQHVSVVGRSGSGKSTLLNILGMLDTPTSGTYTFDEVDVTRARSGARDRSRGRDIGFIFQQFNLLPGRSAIENVMMPLLYATGRQFWRRQAIAADMLDRVGLGSRLDSPPHRMSGGEQQRVAIARALVRRPRVILADEPTGALDVETGNSVMRLLDEVTSSSGASLITITHDPAIAARADRRFRLEGGVLTRDELVASSSEVSR